MNKFELKSRLQIVDALRGFALMGVFLVPTTSTISGWSEDELTESGKIIRNYLNEMNTGIFENLK